MTISGRFHCLSRRGVRIIVLTVLIATVACECDTSDPVSQCFVALTNRGCIIPPGADTLGGAYQTVSYIPAGSDCVSCSSCRDIQSATIDAFGGCIEGCKAACGD